MVHFCLYWNCLSFSVCFKQVWAGEKSIGSEVSAGLEGQTHRHAFGGVPLGKPLGLSGSQFLLLLLFSCQVVSHSCDPMDCGPPVSVYGISQARILKWAAISFSRGSSQPRDRTCVSCIGRQILSHWATWEAPFLPLHGGGEGDNNWLHRIALSFSKMAYSVPGIQILCFGRNYMLAVFTKKTIHPI